jgi:hypothetical protein
MTAPTPILEVMMNPLLRPSADRRQRRVRPDGPRAVSAALLPIFAALLVALAPDRASSTPPSTINVEIDYMATPHHSHKPQPNEIAAVVQMFACHGITLNVVVDESIAEVDTLKDGPLPNDFFTATGPKCFAPIKAAHFNHTGGGWHYCIFGARYIADGQGNGSSGLGEILGDDFVVTLGPEFTDSIGTPWDRAATFAHELGHNLGLTHAGDQNVTLVGLFKPIYTSIMSYQFQLSGVRRQLMCLGLIDTTSTFKNLDYSNGFFPTVNESSLSEPRGVGIHAADWNCSGVIDGTVSQDLNGTPWCGANGTLSTLDDYDDWSNIQDVTANLPLLARSTVSEPCAYAPSIQVRSNNPNGCPSGQPAPLQEPCVQTAMFWVNSAYTGGTQNGKGDSPYKTLRDAYNAAPNGSVLYLQPGSYSASGTLNRAMTLAGSGGVGVGP